MRLLLICLALAACDDNSTNSPDLSALADLSHPPDLTALLNCKDTQACTQACPAANLDTCVPGCIARLEQGAKMYFDPLQACAGPTCTVIDGGLGPCAMPASAACNSCVMQNCASEEAACLAH